MSYDLRKGRKVLFVFKENMRLLIQSTEHRSQIERHSSVGFCALLLNNSIFFGYVCILKAAKKFLHFLKCLAINFLAQNIYKLENF